MHALWQSTNQEHVDDMDKAVNVQIYLQIILCLRHSAKYKHRDVLECTYSSRVVSSPRSVCRPVRCLRCACTSCQWGCHSRTCSASWPPRIAPSEPVTYCPLQHAVSHVLLSVPVKYNKLIRNISMLALIRRHVFATRIVL